MTFGELARKASEFPPDEVVWLHQSTGKLNLAGFALGCAPAARVMTAGEGDDPPPPPESMPPDIVIED